MSDGVKTPVDVLVVGSGPVGSAFARAVHERDASLRIMMLEAGPLLTERPGVHVKNIADRDARRRAQLRSQGPDADLNAEVPDGAPQPGIPRPGTAHVEAGSAPFPEGAISTNVGGMGAHWTCACPRPGDGERVPFLPTSELDEVLARAESYLSVRRLTTESCRPTGGSTGCPSRAPPSPTDTRTGPAPTSFSGRLPTRASTSSSFALTRSAAHS